MSEDRKQILQMLSDGAVNADEAERLIAALETSHGTSVARTGAKPKFLHVLIDAAESADGPAKVNVRVPFQLLRAGVRLSSMIPPEARDKANAAMKEKGVNFDLSKLSPDNLDDLIEQLQDLQVDIDGHKGKAKVRVFCE